MSVILKVHYNLPIDRAAQMEAGDPLNIASLERTTRRVFHDTLTSIHAVRTEGLEHAKLKSTALKAWRGFGRLFDLKEGQRVTTTNIPSELSTERAYWNIPKRCFLNSCSCSAMDDALHPMRVCKGCYRALYCSQQCQTL